MNPKLELILQDLKKKLILQDLKKKRRKDNEERAYSEQGIKKETEKFHEPVTRKLKEEREQQHEYNDRMLDYMNTYNTELKTIEDDHREQLKMIQEVRAEPVNFNVDKDLHEEYLILNGWQLPSKITTDVKLIEETLLSVANKNQSLGGTKRGKSGDELQEIQNKIDHNRIYLKALRALLEGNQLFNPTQRGSGLLVQLTNNLIQDPNNEMLKISIRNLLSKLFKDKQIDHSYLKDFKSVFNI
jgi:hypothetical protein